MEEMKPPLKVSGCPWCQGSGKKYIISQPYDMGNSGEGIFVNNAAQETCRKCEGTGVIAFKSLSVVKDD